MGLVREGHNSSKHGQRGAQWPSVSHTRTRCTGTLPGGPRWGRAPCATALPHPPRQVPSHGGLHRPLQSQTPQLLICRGGRGPQGSERPGSGGCSTWDTQAWEPRGGHWALHAQVPKGLMWLMKRSSVSTQFQPPVCWMSSVPAKPGWLDLLFAESEVQRCVP